MKRIGLIGILLTIVLAGCESASVTSPAHADEASPPGRIASTFASPTLGQDARVLLDFPAMVLRAKDLGVSGYLQWMSNLDTLEPNPWRTPEDVAALRAEGEGPAYFSELQSPQSDSRDPYQVVKTEIHQYTDDAAALRRYDEMVFGNLQPEYVIASGDQPVAGDETIIRGLCDCGEATPDRVIGIAFRQGDLLARVMIGNRNESNGPMPDRVLALDTATVERLAGILSQRMSAVAAQGAGIGLGPIALRTSQQAYSRRTLEDDYRRLGGEDYPKYFETIPIFAWPAEELDSVVDLYVASQNIEIAGNTSSFDAYLSRYPDAKAASAAIRRLQHFKPGDPDDTIDRVKLAQFGDESTAYVETDSFNDLRSFVIAARIDTIVVQIRVETFVKFSIDRVEPMMAAQVACVENGGCTSYALDREGNEAH